MTAPWAEGYSIANEPEYARLRMAILMVGLLEAEIPKIRQIWLFFKKFLALSQTLELRSSGISYQCAED